jgi:molybdopterin adenylyltransferase
MFCAKPAKQNGVRSAKPRQFERMRSEGLKRTSRAALSRAVCGVRGATLILNLPGSPTGAVESLEPVADLIPHMIDLLSGKTEHG